MNISKLKYLLDEFKDSVNDSSKEVLPTLFNVEEVGLGLIGRVYFSIETYILSDKYDSVIGEIKKELLDNNISNNRIPDFIIYKEDENGITLNYKRNIDIRLYRANVSTSSSGAINLSNDALIGLHKKISK